MVKYRWTTINDINYKEFMRRMRELKDEKRIKSNYQVNVEERDKVLVIQKSAKDIEDILRNKFSTTDKLILCYKRNFVDTYIEVDGRDGMNIFEIKVTSSKTSRGSARQRIREQYERLSSIIGKNNFNYYCILVLNNDKKTDTIFYPIDVNIASNESDKFHYNCINIEDLDKIDELDIIIYQY